MADRVPIWNPYSQFDTKEEWEAKRQRFKPDLEAFDEWPKTGEMPDGSPIRTHNWHGRCVREPGGYICSPVAYAVRKSLGVTWFAGKRDEAAK